MTPYRFLAASLLLAAACYAPLPPLKHMLAQEGGAADRAIQQQNQKMVKERGVLEAESEVTIRCTVPETNVIDVAAEGKHVEKGDLLLTLDSSIFMEQRREASVAVRVATARIAQLEQQHAALARQTAEVKRAAALREKAAAAETAARLGDGGELDLEVREAEGQIKLHQQRLALVQQQLQRHKQAQADEGTTAQLELAVLEAREALSTAEARKTYIETLKREQVRAALEAARAAGKLELDRQAFELDRQLGAVAATIEQQKGELRAAQERLDLVEEQIAACRIQAPRDGTLLYANVYSSRVGRGDLVLEPGARVRQGQALLRIVDLSRLRVRALVGEKTVPRVRAGQPAAIRIDALPDMNIRGKVTRVSRFPEPSGFGQNVRMFPVEVTLDKPLEHAKIGMTAMVEIDTSR